MQDGKVVFAGGFGVRDLATGSAPDADTLYIVASNTKALTTLMLGKLLDEGKLTWDTPVTRLLPSFKLGDADTTSRVLVKHLICACTGLPRQDFEWLFQYQGVTAQDGPRHARHDQADDQVRRALPVFEPHGGGGRLHGRPCRVPLPRARRGL